MRVPSDHNVKNKIFTDENIPIAKKPESGAFFTQELKVTLDDLQPLHTKREHTYKELATFIDNTHYQTDWSQPMKEEYEILYSRKGNKSVDFFKVKDTGLIVMPGTYLYPTVLTTEDIEKMNREYEPIKQAKI